MLLALFVADMVSGEMESESIKVLLTKPVSRGKILFSKYLAAIFTTNFLVLFLEGLVFLFLGVAYGFGNPNLPMVVGTKYRLDPKILIQPEIKRIILPIIGSSEALSSWQVIIRLLLFQCLLIIACVSFCFLLSVFFKHSLASNGISFMFFLVTYFITCNETNLWAQQMNGIESTTFTQKVLPYIFSSYFDSLELWKGTFASKLLNPMASINFAVMVCILWTLLSYLISHIIFTRKEIL